MNMGEHTQQRVDLQYRLTTPSEPASPGTRHKTWFFDLPVERERPDAWEELLQRIFYDANVKLRRREPGDEAWLALDRFEISPVDVGIMLAWDGTMSWDAAAAHLPWLLSAAAAVWEFAACYIVDDAGAYDGMEGEDFTELVLCRALRSGRVTEPDARAFLDRFYPGRGEAVFADRRQRFRNLLGLRDTVEFRKAPGAQPWCSGPVREADLQLR
jgi:hypothetical protein